jgi:hypothetical protein
LPRCACLLQLDDLRRLLQIGGVELRQISRDTFFELLAPALDLGVRLLWEYPPPPGIKLGSGF